MKEDSKRIIEQLNNKYGEDKTDRLLSYLDMVLERNEHINLTAVRDRNEALVKHVADSLAVTDLPEYVQAKRIIDIGTGAGFPGALLAIVSPDKEFVLLDSTLKRLKVIDEFAETLGLKNITTVHTRAEEISKKPEYKEGFDLCVSRAVASLDKLAGWCLPFVKKGGSFVSYKGENYLTEIEEAGKALKRFKGSVDRVAAYPADSPADISGHVLIVIGK
ncbi:MAG: 16S rRNA (guanine(527)-N(7))-methyltransferase RsmG [Clostridiales bacterium]|jgi:16S rRNA (guanine527-N7)-methyltransferase|nr:16S rRNA (guanine(527)-N(7))-methyltransferase RsmG [Clostridiales bacterium]